MRTSTSARPSPTKEDYIRALYLIEESGKEPRVVDIAKRLGLSKSTVSERLKALTEQGFAKTAPYSNISLTKKGRLIGAELTYKHRLIEVFLHQTLKLPKQSLHQEAELLEHACSDIVIKKLADFLNHPTHDPHGSPITK